MSAAATVRHTAGDHVTEGMMEAALIEGALEMKTAIEFGRITPPINRYRNSWMRWAFDMGVRETVWLSYNKAT